MPVTPIEENPRGYASAKQNDNITNAINAIKNEISRDVDSLGLSRFVRRKSEDQFNTEDSLADVADLEFPIGANEAWQFDAELLTGCDSVGGIAVAVDGPAGATLRAVTVGVTSTPNSGGRGRLTDLDTPSIAYNTYDGADGDVRIVGSIVAGVTAGTVKVRFQVVVDGHSGCIYAGSTLVANKVSS